MTELEILRELVKTGENFRGIICTVDSVDTSKYQCDLTPVDGSAPIKAARLTAKESVNNTMLLVPKVGSFVIAGQISRTDTWVAMCDEVDDIIVMNHAKITIQNETDVEIINKGNVTIANEGDVEINAGGKAVLKNAQTSVKSILNDLIDDLINAVIATPAGPGNFDPSTVAKFNQANQLVNQLFKE